jgi:NTP pyrophosphatase (non-canonical NTP hydrolase)
MGELNEAMSLYQEFLTVAKARLGSEHCDVAIMYKCTAQIHQERNEFDIAKQMVEKGLLYEFVYVCSSPTQDDL